MVDSGYRHFYGQDWPPVTTPDGTVIPVSRELAGLIVGKKWRFFKEQQGVEFDVEPWVAMLDAAKSLLPGEYSHVSEWAEQHFHDWCMCPKGIVTIGCASCGKAQPLDSIVYTPDGPARMGDLEIGDTVLTPYGSSEIIKTHDVGVQDEYVVRFSDGTECVCAGSHLWNVGTRHSRPTRKTVDAKWLSENASPGRFFIDACPTMAFRRRRHVIDPYVFGALLGDGMFGGSSGTSMLALTNIDQDIVSRVGSRLSDGYVLKRQRSGVTYSISRIDASGARPNTYIRELKRMGLWASMSWEKFVPEEYLYSDDEDRLEVLRGILDTDGTVGKGGGISISVSSRRLSDNIAFLARSLGAVVTRSETPSSYVGKDGIRRLCRTSYNLFIHTNRGRDMFTCTRKVSRTRGSRRGNNGRRYILSVVKNGRSSVMKCITLTDTRGLYVTNDCIVTHNSYDYGHLVVLDYTVDPFDTVILVGSTTKEALKSRIWNFIEQCHAALRKNPQGMPVPGKITKSGYALVNISDEDSPESVGDKAGIQGRALNEDGNLQGAHGKFVRLVVDELATIRNHDAITTAMTNLRTGALDFRFAALANPESWEDPSCGYIMPEGGYRSVTPDTGFWTSTRGYWVRHHDGIKSPALTQEGAEKYPFLMTQRTIDDNLADCNGNWDAPQMWKMVRGFPMGTNVSAPVVLDRKIADQNRVTDQPEEYGEVVGVAAGIDPAWSEGGDGAVYQRVLIRRLHDGRHILDFSNGQHKLAIKVSDGTPVTQQLVDQTKDIMRDPGGYGASLSATAVDASANQGLADSLDILIGQGAESCIHVNYSLRASSYLVRALGIGQTDSDDRKSETCKDRFQDRGTESWCLLAEYCKAGMVRGLPERVVQQITMRRFAMKVKKSNGQEIVSGVQFPLRLEEKADFKRRYKASPDECDACSLAAVAVRQAFGLLPYGSFTPAEKPLIGDSSSVRLVGLTLVDIPNPEAYNTESDSGRGYFEVSEDSGW